jgi:hypothetical protein
LLGINSAQASADFLTISGGFALVGSHFDAPNYFQQNQKIM